MDKITSAKNERIKDLKKLEKQSVRKERNLFLIEGLRELVLAIRAGYELVELYICEEFLQDDSVYPVDTIYQTKSKKFQITKGVYESVAYRGSTEGVLALAAPKKHSLNDFYLKQNPLVLVIESVEKPGNLGAMLRTCDAAGVDDRGDFPVLRAVLALGQCQA